MTSAGTSTLDIRLLTPDLLYSMRTVLRGSWGSTCWCMFPRITGAQWKKLPGEGSGSQRRRAAMEDLARRSYAPGLLAFQGEDPVGWVAVAPRSELARIEKSRATPMVDDQDVWVIPCVTVHRNARGQGVAVALIQAAATICIRARGSCSRGLPPSRKRAHRRRQYLFRNRAPLQTRRLRNRPRTPPRPPPQLASSPRNAFQPVAVATPKVDNALRKPLPAGGAGAARAEALEV